MAKAQFPIDGKLGRDFKVTSYMGMRIHPVTKDKKHHNGTDIWSPHEPCIIEAPFDGKVLEAKKSTAPGGGFGNFVILLHKINGKQYTSLYAHMKDGSIKVKKGQRIEAGTPLGKMGTTGMSTGKHLHWELRLGNKHVWDANGKHYIEPIAFFKALIAQEKAIASAPVTAKDDDPVQPEPVHSEEHAAELEAQRQEVKSEAVKPVVKEVPKEVIPTAPTGTPKEVIDLALKFASQKYKEGRKDDTIFGKWYGANHAAWCAMFVSYIFNHAGAGRYIKGVQTHKGFSSCTAAIKEFKARGQWHNVKDAQPGDIIFFDWEQNKDPDHVGIVVGHNNPKAGTIQTVEGNTSSGKGGSQSYGDGVYVRTRYYKNIIGVARPYPEHHDAPVAAPAVNTTPEVKPVAVPAVNTTPEVKPVVVPASTPVASEKVSNPGYPGHYMAKGSGEKREVAFMRQQLGLPAGTDFDDALDHAVRALQKKHGLTADGIVGPKTWAVLD